MPVRKVCQNFFRDALAAFHKYRQSALIDASVALINGASLTLTSIGRFLPGQAQVKNKIKRVDRLLGNEQLQKDIPMIFKGIISMLTCKLSLCVIAVDWSGYPSQEYHVLRASLICDGRSIPLLSHIVPSSKQNSSEIQKGFLNALAETIRPGTKVIVITDAGFRNAWFRHIKSLGWDFVGRIRGNTQLRLNNNGEKWLRTGELIAGDRPEHLGEGTLSQSTPCDGHFYIQKTKPKGRKHKRARCRIRRSKQVRCGRSAAKEPWLLFVSTDEFKPREVMKLYSRRMQIEQNFRDEKSERFGFGLRASYRRSAGRILVLTLLATLSTIVLWLLGFHAENKGLHLRYQANSINSRRVISYLTLAKNVLRHSPLILTRISLGDVLNNLTRVYRNMDGLLTPICGDPSGAKPHMNDHHLHRGWFKIDNKISDFGCGERRAKVAVRCPFCEQTDPVKKHGDAKSGHQRYRCQACKRTFQLDYAYRACLPGMKDQLVDLAMNNAGMRDTARALHISINAVVRPLKNSRRGM